MEFSCGETFVPGSPSKLYQLDRRAANTATMGQWVALI